MNSKDVFAIFDDIKGRMLGVGSNYDRNGCLASFLGLGIPINVKDYENPWNPYLRESDKQSTQTVKEKAKAASPASDIYQNLSNLCVLVNPKIKLDGSGLALPTSTKISETWELIVKSAKATSINVPISLEEQKQIDNANKLLFKTDEAGNFILIKIPDNDTPGTYSETRVDSDESILYDSYQKEYRKKRDNLVQKYNASHSDADWGIIGLQYIDEVDRAFDNWASAGRKAEIEQARDFLATRGGDAATIFLRDTKANLEKFRVATGGRLPQADLYSYIIPSNWYDIGADIYATYNYDSQITTSGTNYDEASYGAVGGYLGLWSVSAAGKITRELEDFNFENLQVSFEYSLVRINRPWLDTIVFNLDNWELPNYPKGCISNGEDRQARPQRDEASWLPSIPTNLFFVKNVIINFDNSAIVKTHMESKRGASGGIGIGPFFIGGRYKDGSTHDSFYGDFTESGIIIKGLQLMGYLSETVPFTPQMPS